MTTTKLFLLLFLFTITFENKIFCNSENDLKDCDKVGPVCAWKFTKYLTVNDKIAITEFNACSVCKNNLIEFFIIISKEFQFYEDI